MFKKILKFVGSLKRGLIGFFVNNFEIALETSHNIIHFKIGESASKNPIICYQINRGEKKILFVSAIHGNEVGTVKLAYHLINFLNAKKEKFKEFTFYIIPCLNPDGYKLAIKNPDYLNGGKIGRFNGNNVDLNRNFNTPSFKSASIWSFGRNYAESEKVFCGKYGGSEPEIKALTNFIAEKNIKVLYIFHNAGGDVMGNNNRLSQELAKNYSLESDFRYISINEHKNLNHSGQADEWCDINNIAYIEIEGASRWGSDWNKQKNALLINLDILKRADI